ncbi:MAG TPA: PEP-CTERM sorting domain-containing protein [Lacipirellula sp.]
MASLQRCAIVFLTTISLATLHASPGQAVTVGAIDDFQDGTTAGWGGGGGASNLADAGPTGAGDNALRVATGSGRVAIVNTTQWTGDFLAAGVTQLQMDIRNESGFPLEMRIGVANGPVGSGGAGDTYVSAMSVPVVADSQWHRIALSLSPADFIPHTANTNPAPNAAAALANVSHFRILHNPMANFLGAMGPATFYLDNIRAVPEPHAATLALLALGLIAARQPRRTA